MNRTMSRWWPVLGAVLMALGCSVGRAQSPGVVEAEQISGAATTALWWGDFAELERQHALYQQPNQRTVAGRSRLAMFRGGIANVMKGPSRSRDGFFLQMDELTLRWAQSNPQSPAAHVMHAHALQQHAWSYRGTGFAKSVPPEAWRDFKRYVEKAIDYLAAHREVALRSSSGHVELLNLGRLAGWDLQTLWAVARAGLALNPDDEGLFRGMLVAALPKWGGSAVQVDQVVNEIATLTAKTHGDIYYSRMYAWAADEDFSHDLFKSSGVSWPRMKAGYQQLIERYPDASNYNPFAYFACMARDKPTLLDMLDRVGPIPNLSMWGSNPSRTYETCKRWASEQ